MLMAKQSFSQSCEYEERVSRLRNLGYSIGDEFKAACRESGEAYAYRRFYQGTTYTIVGSSDDKGVSDVDLFIYDTDGVTILRRDVDRLNVAVVSFVPNYTVTLKVVIKNYRSGSPDFASTLRFVVAYQ